MKIRKNKILKKLSIAFSMVAVGVCAFFGITKTYAYTYDSATGNLYSDNLFHTNTNTTSAGVSYVADNNGYIKIDGTATGTGINIVFQQLVVTPGTYYVQNFSSSYGSGSAPNLTIRLGSTGGSQVYAETGNIKRSFTISTPTTLFIGMRSQSGTTYSGYLRPMISTKDFDEWEPYNIEWVSKTNNANQVEQARNEAITNLSTQYEIFHSGTPSTRQNVDNVTCVNLDGSISSYDNFNLFISSKHGFDTCVSFTINLVKPYPVNTLSFNTNASDGFGGRENSYISSIILDNKFVINDVSNELYKYLFYSDYYENTLISSITYNLDKLNGRYVLSEGLNIHIRYTGSNIANAWYEAGYSAGANSDDVYNKAYGDGYDQGVKVGYDKGYNAGASIDGEFTTSGKNLIWTIATTPFESFKTIWNVNVLGINIAGFITGLITLGIAIFILKKIF